MYSVGIDMVEIGRIEKSMKSSRFLKIILGKSEYIQLEKRNFPKQSIAANFCAKEAFSKALGTGMRGLKMHDIQILRNSLGKPYFLLSGSALSISNEKNLDFSLSITHTKTCACAVVICFKKNLEDNYGEI